jgi:hypothetical protein
MCIILERVRVFLTINRDGNRMVICHITRIPVSTVGGAGVAVRGES